MKASRITPFLILLMVAGASWQVSSDVHAQQTLLNIAPRPSDAQAAGALPAGMAPRAPVTTYAPSVPLANSDPGVLEEPELIARYLNEDDATYTARMERVQEQLIAERDQILRRHEAALQRTRSVGIGAPVPAQQTSR